MEGKKRDYQQGTIWQKRPSRRNSRQKLKKKGRKLRKTAFTEFIYYGSGGEGGKRAPGGSENQAKYLEPQKRWGLRGWKREPTEKSGGKKKNHRENA